ncbi:MAG: cupin, partial [Pseudomonadales bacterium]|nr:cupin [Pseudomonadales bacterium]
MQINTDHELRVVMNTHEVVWTDAPVPGVQRRMLERDGVELARATSIVRYEKGAEFTSHTHDGGEEILVLEGTLIDELGSYGP